MGTDFKKVKVKFLNGTRFKVVTLPKTSEHSDLKNLKEQLLAEMVFDDSIVAIGGSKGSCAGDLVLFYFDEEFAEDVEVPRDMPLTHLTTLTLKHCGSRSGPSGLLQQPPGNNSIVHTAAAGTTQQALIPSSSSGSSGQYGPGNEGLHVGASTSSVNVENEEIAPTPTTKKSRPKQDIGKLRNKTKQIIPALPELTATLKASQQKHKNLSPMVLPFVLHHAKHLATTIPYPTRIQYDKYCELIVDTYPEFKNEETMESPNGWMKKDVVKCIQNLRAYNALDKEKAKETALLKKSGPVPSGATESAQQNEEEILAIKGFQARRQLVATRNGPSIKLLLERVPEYKLFKTVLADCMRLDPIKDFKEEVFEGRFRTFICNMARFLEQDAPDGKHHQLPAAPTALELCMEVNKLTSATQGTVSVPLLVVEQAGVNAPKEDYPKHRVPHCKVYHGDHQLFSVQHPGLMIIFCGDGSSFRIEGITSESQVILYLLAAYYAFDVKYPAQYRILPILDMFCLTSRPIAATAAADNPPAPGPSAPKKRKKVARKPSATIVMKGKLAELVRRFQEFLKNEPVPAPAADHPEVDTDGVVIPEPAAAADHSEEGIIPDPSDAEAVANTDDENDGDNVDLD